MYNFFWSFFSLFSNLSDGIFVLLLSLVVSIPCLLGFLFSALHSKARFKLLWLTLWIATTMVVLMGVNIMLTRACEFDLDHWGSFWGMIVSLFFAVVLYLFCSLLGRKYNPRKKWQWLLIPVMVVASVINVWSVMYLGVMWPFASIEDEELDQTALTKSEGFDFEIYLADVGAFMDEEGMPIQPGPFKIRGKGDSVYCHFVTEKSTDWTLLDESKTSVAIKLKKAIASYRQEFSADEILDGYCTNIILDDFQKAIRRRLVFCNADGSHVHDALAIERMFNQLKKCARE
ncbi:MULTISPECIES: hypothetical protein [unclassified Fibrobacter]|uniref:hypothetical protein n=1 Tax=unclassified Fibrobacter TaxID=2634177 RepID=UPI000D6C94B5|nr:MULTISPECIES: hypothetical protein [unclassified Fibrobacter]PWJ65569.1 hypothetical protein BGX12_11356 [Fibrobacter sp. UWR4]PZW72334.1 hypothetical protein C8E88_100763 [Fibrobacter sp. UWR1]